MRSKRIVGCLYVSGDIIGLHLPGNQTLLILNSVEAATELLDKRAATYSDRPKSPLVDLYVPCISTIVA